MRLFGFVLTVVKSDRQQLDANRQVLRGQDLYGRWRGEETTQSKDVVPASAAHSPLG